MLNTSKNNKLFSHRILRGIKPVFLIFFFSFSVTAQENLVQNGSFEDIDSCYGQPAGIGFDVFEWTGCLGWSCPIASSSDLWCPHPVGGTEPPNIAGLGYQQPRTGENMAGILENGGIIISYREFIQNELTQPLKGNIFYQLSFYHSPLKVDCSINQFGVLAVTTKMENNSDLELSHLTPNGVSNINQFTSDTSAWNYCEIFFTAQGGEKFIVIGNFQDSTNATYAEPCDTSFWNGQSYAGNYFFIDDVSLIEMPFIVEFPNVFTPNNDGDNDNWTPTIINAGDWKIDILNRWGNLVTTLNQNNPNWTNPRETDGVYFYHFSSKDFPNENRSGFIHLIR